MEKILLLANALDFKVETLDFAAYICKLNKSKLTGVFIEQQSLDTVSSIKTIGGTAFVEEITVSAEEQRNQLNLVEKNIATFKGGCKQKDVLAVVHHDKGNALEQVIEESRYADLIITDPSFSFDGDGKVPSKFVVELLSKAECPVLIAPEYYAQTDEIVLAYDGSRSSVFAIKQFYYQMSKLADKRVTVLHINKDSSPKKHGQHAYFKEWLDMHFANVSFLELSGEARDILFEYFMTHNDHNNKMLVTGAFGRNYLSTFFRPSTAELVLKAVDIPIFITHH
jgi:hypothetical protein